MYVWSDSTMVSLTGVSVLENIATFDGGGVAITSVNGSLSALDSSFDSNQATNGGGGGIYATVPTTIDLSNISNNTARASGGLIVGDHPLVMTDSAVVGNEAREDNGGGINAFRTTANLTNVTISHNSSIAGRAAGVSAEGGVFTNVTVADNGPGFGVWGVFATITVRNSIIALNDGDCGGGVASPAPTLRVTAPAERRFKRTHARAACAESAREDADPRAADR